MRIGLAADHAGAELKDELRRRLPELAPEHDYVDLGGDGSDPTDDYPDFARRIGEAVRRGEVERGILVCGSGVGAAIAASKLRGIRAALCHDTYSARQGVEHDDMNVLCLGARVVGPELAVELARAFLGARFSGEERHRRRLGKILAIEAAEAGAGPGGVGAAEGEVAPEGGATPGEGKGEEDGAAAAGAARATGGGR